MIQQSTEESQKTCRPSQPNEEDNSILCGGVNYCVNAKLGNETIRGCGIPQFDPASIATGSFKANYFLFALMDRNMQVKTF